MIRCIKNTEASLNQKLVFGTIAGSPVSSLLVRANLDPADVTIYDNYAALFTTNCFSELANTPEELEMDCFQPVAITEGTDNLDYAAMTQTDKDKVDAFIDLVNRKNDLPT